MFVQENIKKSAAGGKQSEEREEEMLSGCESDRGWKTKECQEGWGRRRFFSFGVLHVHLQPLMDRSEIRENRRSVRLQMRSSLCTPEVRGSEGQKQATKTCVLPGLAPLLRLHCFLYQIYSGHRCYKHHHYTLLKSLYWKKKHLGLRSNVMIFLKLFTGAVFFYVLTSFTQEWLKTGLVAHLNANEVRSMKVPVKDWIQRGVASQSWKFGSCFHSWRICVITSDTSLYRLQ